MDKEQMEQQFLSRYDQIVQSGDTRQMERLEDQDGKFRIRRYFGLER